MRRAWVAPVVALAVAACGGGSDGPLAETDARLDDIRSARLTLEFSGRALEGGAPSSPVGFRLVGPFSFDSEGRYPVLRMTYTRLLGDDAEEVTVTSTGDAVYVGSNRVDESRLGAFELGDGERVSGLEQLELADWVDDADTRTEGDATVVTGTVSVADAFADLAALARQLGVPDTSDLGDLTEDDRERLDRLVERSSVRIESDADDHTLRALELEIDLRPGDANDRRALGSLVGARLALKLTLDDVNEPVRVEPPGNS